MRPNSRKRLPNWLIGLVLMGILACASYLAFAKTLPWTHKYTVKAVFAEASNIRPSSPVRIAGVNVGKVSDVEPLGTAEKTASEASGQHVDTGAPQQAAVVTMELDDTALPLHTDATIKVRPRLFLEGNLFVDLHPGSPEAPEAKDGYTFPITQTSTAVQLDQVLTTLQSDVRSNVQILLDQFGNALTKYGGAKGLRAFYRSSPDSFKYTSLVNEALLGKSPHDLSGLVRNLNSTVKALDSDESGLKDLITNFRTVTGSFAAQNQDLALAINELPRTLAAGRPALASLNASFPQVRAFAREALPGVRSTPATLDAATPFLNQVRGLVSKPELRGLVHDLRPTIPNLTKLSARTIPFLKQGRRLSSCFNEVVTPWSQGTVPDSAIPADGKVFQELGYGLEGLNGESRTGDGNGEIIRVVAGGGTNTVKIPGSDPSNPGVGVTPLPLLGAMPAINSSAKTPFRPDVRCETQAPPNLNPGNPAAPPQQAKAPAARPVALNSSAKTDAKSAAAELAAAQKLLSAAKTKAKNHTAIGDQQDGVDKLNKLLLQSYGLGALIDRLKLGSK